MYEFSEAKLQPCPFCGQKGQPYLRILYQEIGYTVGCTLCSVMMRVMTPHGALGLQQVVVSWNRRFGQLDLIAVKQEVEPK